VVETAAPKGIGLAELEEAVLLQAEIMDLRATADGRAEGAVVEARRDKGQGPVATVIIKRGRLQVRRAGLENFAPSPWVAVAYNRCLMFRVYVWGF